MPIRSSSDASVTTLTIERPERRGAIDRDHLEELHAAVAAAVADGARALVLAGSDGHFCAGADLKTLEDVEFTVRLAEVLRHLAAVPVTTVAAISGSCMGLGMQLAVACDLRVVADDARFAVPVARLGLMVDRWTVERVVRAWGDGATRAMVLTGAVLDSADAWRLGFAQRRGDLTAAQELAAAAVPLAPLSQAGSKLGLDLGPADDGSAYQEAFHRAWASEDLREGRAAFVERRPAVFVGR